MLLTKKLLPYQGRFPMLITDITGKTVNLAPGSYRFTLRGGGGAGGEKGGNGAGSTGGAGGAGGKGALTVTTVNFSTFVDAYIYVGEGGKIASNGGNGGAGGNGGSGGGYGGAGGGGGKPSLVLFGDNTYLSADGGGGGGGGGGASNAVNARFQWGAGGGGGGGRYTGGPDTNSTTPIFTSISGQKGGNQGPSAHQAGRPGVAGDVTNFPDCVSGKGGVGGDLAGARAGGGAAASGGGASGGGGGTNNANNDYSCGGAGGGGAGGDYDAGGGEHGRGGFYGAATDAYNFHTTPTDTTAENATCGVTGDYGIGGTTNTEGTSGFVLIELIG